MSRIIDVGCGCGEGLAALRDTMVATGTLLVGLDENPNCLRAAARRLGISDSQRLRRIGGGGREHNLEVIPGKLTPPAPIFLAQTDILRPDPELDNLIRTAAPYDAVTLWFTGVHPAREFDAYVNALESHLIGSIV